MHFDTKNDRQGLQVGQEKKQEAHPKRMSPKMILHKMILVWNHFTALNDMSRPFTEWVSAPNEM